MAEGIKVQRDQLRDKLKDIKDWNDKRLTNFAETRDRVEKRYGHRYLSDTQETAYTIHSHLSKLLNE